MSDRVRHILSMSGGKDSTALAVYMRDRQPDMEYVFCDTEKELQETYDYLAKVEAYLGKPVIRLNDERGFDHWLEVYGHYLPSPQMRWCTRQLKIRPFERFVGDDPVISYIGIRGDEHRDGYISSKPNITPPIRSRKTASPSATYTAFWTSPDWGCPTTTSGGRAPGATSASSSARRSGWA